MNQKQKGLLFTAVILVVLGLVLRFFTIGGMKFSFYICVGLALILLFFCGVEELSKYQKFRLLSRILNGAMLVLIGLGAALFLVLEGFILSGAHTEEAQKVDCVLILGAGVDGTVPSLTLQSRLDAAIAYLKDWDEIPVIVSGGQGPGEEITEAEAMRRYLEANDIAEDRIVIEDQSASTEENMAFSKEAMEEIGLDPDHAVVAVVTSEFHLYRAKLLARRYGLNPVGVAAETPIFMLKVNYFVREAAALAKTIVIR